MYFDFLLRVLRVFFRSLKVETFITVSLFGVHGQIASIYKRVCIYIYIERERVIFFSFRQRLSTELFLIKFRCSIETNRSTYRLFSRLYFYPIYPKSIESRVLCITNSHKQRINYTT